jgi:hypothetical protein
MIRVEQIRIIQKRSLVNGNPLVGINQCAVSFGKANIIVVWQRQDGGE